MAVLSLGLISSQGAVAAWLGWGSYAPEWALTLTIYVVLHAGPGGAALAAFGLGLFRDAAGGGLPGVYPTALIAVAWFFYPFRRRFNFSAPLPLAVIIFALVLGSDFLVLTPIMVALGRPGAGFSSWPAFLGSALTTALTAPPLFWALDRLTRRRASGRPHG
ncbi:MAG: rod shape-determining protein MreD [Candidatus Adiutrix sp.]|jgi:rod shape-determining protein MreD|nr:rod shape-determining protein MreD [Candidatus Adiutrix sp.]